jgi:hypothetical protein
MLSIKFHKPYRQPSDVSDACPSHCRDAIEVFFEAVLTNHSLISNVAAFNQVGFNIRCFTNNIFDPINISRDDCCFKAAVTEKNDLIDLIRFDCAQPHP